jgi:hypothetical protein
MNYIFKIVDIIVFDVHTSVQPLLNLALVHPQFQFLVDPAKYAKQHDEASVPVVLGDLTIEPSLTKPKARNHFWRQCASISHGTAPDVWKLQIPFVCKATTVNLEFSTGLPKTRVLVLPSIYLSALGWSTSLHLRIFGAMSPSDLAGVVDGLRHDSRFVVEGATNKTLSDAFIALSNVVKRNLYVAVNPLYDRVTTPRHTVISIAKYDGALAAFSSAQMQQSDRAEIHSILFGHPMDLIQLAKNEEGHNFLLTQYAPYDFALTYFELGTLLWMQSPRRKGKRTSLWCLPSNVASCSMFLLELSGFWKITGLQAAANMTIKEVREAIKFTVNQLPTAYSNKFCGGFLAHHNELAIIA